MRVLFVGGTGNISGATSRMAVERGFDLVHLNRGRHGGVAGVRRIEADYSDARAVDAALGGERFDAVVNWIAFTPDQVERDILLFGPRTRQYVFISSASAYEKPPRSPFITESTPLRNPWWQYSRDKIAGEDVLVRAFREREFPMTIVRPSLTYDTHLPIAIGGWGCATLIDRLRSGRPIIVHGDGTSLWTVTHAEDFAKAFLGLLGHPAAIGEAFHITSDEVLTWNRIYGSIADAAGAEPKIVHVPSDFIHRVDPDIGAGLLGDKAHSVLFDNSKVKRLVPGFVATIPFHEGIRRTIAWFDADPARYVVRPEVHAAMDRILAAWERAAAPGG
jgi:nucleoside-diphosphate-sugar epimerase